MTHYRYLLYVAPIALLGMVATKPPAAAAALDRGVARHIATATAEIADTSVVLVRGGGRGGGVARGGGGGGGYAGRGGGSWAGAGGGNFNRANVSRGNINTANINRNVNVSGGHYRGYGWGGVAAGVAAGAVVGAAATSAYAVPAYPYCPYPNYPNCGL